MLVILFVVVGALATSLCFARGHRTAGLVGAVAGGVVLVAWVVVVGGSLLDSTPAVVATAMSYAGVMTVIALALRTPRTDTGTPRAGSHERLARVLTGALLGSLPGVLLLGVPVLLSEMGVITADQPQVGFLGLPLVPLGLLVGTALGAALPGHSSERSARAADNHQTAGSH